jgi:hypothetical protein
VTGLRTARAASAAQQRTASVASPEMARLAG